MRRYKQQVVLEIDSNIEDRQKISDLIRNMEEIYVHNPDDDGTVSFLVIAQSSLPIGLRDQPDGFL